MDILMTTLHAERAATYQLLARLFIREVDSDLFRSLSHLQASDDKELADQGLAAIVAYLDECPEDPLTDLAVDYARLFIIRNEYGRDAAYPFESVYTSKEALLMDSARDEVVKLYRQAGFKKDPSWKQGEDHISLELEYMSVLAQKTVQVFENDDYDQVQQLLDTQISFLQNHLLTWISPFTDAMESVAKSGFYKGVALLTRGYLEQDYICLQEEKTY